MAVIKMQLFILIQIKFKLLFLRQLNNNQLNGIIPTQFASLTSLQWL